MSKKTPSVEEFEAFTAEAAREDELRATIRRLAMQLERAKAGKDELVSAVWRAASDAIAGLRIEPVKPPRIDRRTKSRTAELAVSPLADLQLGKVTATYSSEVCAERIKRLADKVIGLTEIQRSDHPVDEIRVYLMGDIVEGELIFPAQAYHVDASLYRQVLEDGPRIICGYLRTMLANYRKVHVIAVGGNHGAIGGKSRRDAHPETNADSMLYRVVKTCFEQAGETRITFDLPIDRGANAWYAIDQIGAKRTFLFHGHQIKGGGGWSNLPLGGFFKAIAKWSANIPGSFDNAICGHWHNAARLKINGRRLWISGSTESNNSWSEEELKAHSDDPTQWLFFQHPERGITTEREVELLS